MRGVVQIYNLQRSNKLCEKSHKNYFCSEFTPVRFIIKLIFI